MMSRPGRKLWRTLSTTVSKEDQARFYALAHANNVTPGEYLRSVVVDLLAEQTESLIVDNNSNEIQQLV